MCNRILAHKAATDSAKRTKIAAKMSPYTPFSACKPILVTIHVLLVVLHDKRGLGEMPVVSRPGKRSKNINFFAKNEDISMTNLRQALLAGVGSALAVAVSTRMGRR
jgi:hypothetical protein